MKTKLRGLIFAASVFTGSAPSLHAQLVADGATNTLSNLTNSFTGDVTVGTNGSFTLLVLSDKAVLTNSANGVIGRNGTARSNEVRLISASARWLVGSNLFVGSNGSFNRLLITNGALVGNRLGTIGSGPLGVSNVAVVTGPGSVWSNANDLFVGLLGVGNQLVVSNGGEVLNTIGEIGRSSGSNNMAVVTGPGSLWNNTGLLIVGRSGGGSQLEVSNGGTLWSGGGTFGVSTSARSNTVVVTGPGSVWSNSAHLSLGEDSTGNRMVVSNGGVVLAQNGAIGAGDPSSNNVGVVTGSGSLWEIAGELSVGRQGSGNQLIIGNGGMVSAGSLYLGTHPTATNSRIELNGGSIRVSNTFGSFPFDLRRGTNVLNAGLIDVNRLLMTNSLGVFQFNGGTLRTGGTSNSNGRAFIVGNGASGATLELRGGTHAFSNNLVIASNASLVGNGAIVGTVTVQPGGTLAPGSSVGRLSLSNSPVWQGATIMEISKVGSLLTNDQVQMAGRLTYGGSLTVTSIGSTTLALGDRFQLFSAATFEGSFSLLALPPLGAGLGWSNKLLMDGSIEVVSTTGPAFVSINPSGTNVIIRGTNGGPNAAYSVLTSTNVALPLIEWSSIATNQFGPGGDFSFTNAIDPGGPQRFFLIRTP